MFDPDHALSLLNILGPLDGRRIRATIARDNVNVRLSTEPLSAAEFQDLMFECQSRGWISKRVDDFGHITIGITEDGQLVREKSNQ